ncbi:EAL domain-containing protein [Mesorhizobium sp. IMUNJ 23232]|uniref:EAL domain-containing protein n=1 Tax=Mesorhizobium sp. IMUNJ 23232 TaxID=3376064 RepID=UPI0037A5FD54
MSPDEQESPVARAIAVDEIGLSFGILGAFRLKTTYQPIFGRLGEMLVPVAMSAAVRIERGGKPAPEDALSTLTPEELALLPRIGRRLAVRNLAHVGCEEPDFDLMLGLSGDVEVLAAEVDVLLEEAGSAGLARDRICFELSGLVGASAFGLLAAGLERLGASYALDLETASNLPGGSGVQIEPPVVRVPPAWTRRIVGEAVLLRVFRLLVTTLKRRGAAVQIEGIEDAAQLRAAIAAGADRLQGDYLSPPALAGTDFDDSPRAFADLIGAPANVVPLSA